MKCLRLILPIGGSRLTSTVVVHDGAKVNCTQNKFKNYNKLFYFDSDETYKNSMQLYAHKDFCFTNKPRRTRLWNANKRSASRLVREKISNRPPVNFFFSNHCVTILSRIKGSVFRSAKTKNRISHTGRTTTTTIIIGAVIGIFVFV